jgi:hypothetical protein
MNQLKTEISLERLEQITEEFAKINREAAVTAEIARELDDFVAALNNQQRQLKPRLDVGGCG